LRWRHTWLGALDGRAGIGGFSSLGRSTPSHTHTHAHTHTHTHLNRNAAADRRLSVSDPRTHARRGARARTYVRPRCWRTGRVQSAHASGLRVHASAQMCVCVRGCARVWWLRTRANVCAPTVCVPPSAGVQTCEPFFGTFGSPFSFPCTCIVFGFFAGWASTGQAVARTSVTPVRSSALILPVRRLMFPAQGKLKKYYPEPGKDPLNSTWRCGTVLSHHAGG
jgi:hypothetical protein